MNAEAQLAVATQRVEALAAQVEATVSDLNQVLDELRSGRLARELMGAATRAGMRIQSDYLDREGAALYLSCSPYKVDRAFRAGLLKQVKFGDTPLYARAELKEALESHRLAAFAYSGRKTNTKKETA